MRRVLRRATTVVGTLALVAGVTTAVPIAAAAAGSTEIQVLGINDFHGRIQANGQEAGAAVLAGAVNQLRTEHSNTVFSAAGDLIGASTFESFIAHDKPTIDALNAAGLEVSAVGNHEFDQGYNDLINRVMKPYDATTNPYGGAQWKYLGANVKMRSSGNPALDPTWVKTFGDVEVGFVGAVTEHLPELVSPGGIADIEVTDIADAVNAEANSLKASGVDIVVMLVHEGAPTTSCASVTDSSNDFGKIVNNLNDNVDAVISGHTHLTYNCMVDVPGWSARAVKQRPVVSAGQYGYNLDQLLFTVSDTGAVTKVESNTLALTKQVQDPQFPNDPTKKIWVANYAADGTVGQIVATAVADADERGKVPLGKIAGPFNRAKADNAQPPITPLSVENRGGESTLGNLVAEAQRWATESDTTGGAQIAFMNPGGLRQDMVGNPGGYPAVLTYKQAATVQPFANTLVNMKLTGMQIKQVLEQQWQPAGASRAFLRLGISKDFKYTYDPAGATNHHILQMWLEGEPIKATQTYSVTVNSFLATGGDNFFELANGGNKKDTGQTDLQAMVDYMAAHAPESGTPLPVDNSQRSVGVHFPDDAPATYQPNGTVTFDLSSLSMSTGTATDSTVTVKQGTADLGSFPVTTTVGAALNDEVGTASVTVTLPEDVPAGHVTLTVTGGEATKTSTEVDIPVCLAAPFEDVAASAAFCSEITWLDTTGITTGYEDGFHPMDMVTRQAMAAFLHRFTFRGAPDPVCTGSDRMFNDVPVGGFCGSIEWLAGEGIANGYGDGGFHPSANVSRQAMAAFLSRDANGEHTPAACTTQKFWDVPVDSPFCAEINWLASTGLTTGYTDEGHDLPGFHPADPISRQAMAAFLYRADQTGVLPVQG